MDRSPPLEVVKFDYVSSFTVALIGANLKSIMQNKKYIATMKRIIKNAYGDENKLLRRQCREEITLHQIANDEIIEYLNSIGFNYRSTI